MPPSVEPMPAKAASPGERIGPMDDTYNRTADLDLGRMRVLDAKPVNLDGFSVTNAELGLVAMRSRYDPEPSLVLRGQQVVELDGKAAEDFDVIDEFIARYGLDLEVAQEAMALDDAVLARMAVDVNVPRAEVARLIGGTTPAKLARVVALLTPVEIQMAMSKMRARRTPSNQAHVTNQLDDPLLIAADAASAVAYGFREVETTVPVLGDAPSNAVALLIGSQVGIAGAMA
jgi:propanediol dehydratase large subunit